MGSHLPRQQTNSREVHKTATVSLVALAIEGIWENLLAGEKEISHFFPSPPKEKMEEGQAGNLTLTVILSLIQPTPPFSSLHPAANHYSQNEI